jgi:hypothetical protein
VAVKLHYRTYNINGCVRYCTKRCLVSSVILRYSVMHYFVNEVNAASANFATQCSDRRKWAKIHVVQKAEIFNACIFNPFQLLHGRKIRSYMYLAQFLSPQLKCSDESTCGCWSFQCYFWSCYSSLLLTDGLLILKFTLAVEANEQWKWNSSFQRWSHTYSINICGR